VPELCNQNQKIGDVDSPAEAGWDDSRQKHPRVRCWHKGREEKVGNKRRVPPRGRKMVVKRAKLCHLRYRKRQIGRSA